MIVETNIDLKVWTLREVGEMEVAARGFIHGVLLSTPFPARKQIRLKYRYNENVSIHISNIPFGESTIVAFGHHIIDDEEGRYTDEVFLCEVDTYSIDFDKHGLGYD